MEIFYNRNTYTHTRAISRVTCNLKSIIIFLLMAMMTQFNSAVSSYGLTTNVYNGIILSGQNKQ